jgi:hypothetical protein
MASSPLQRRLRGVQRKLSRHLTQRIVAPLRAVRNAGRDYRPCFVAGASGGGTSLMALSLAQRFVCAGVINEINIQISPRSFLSVPRLSTITSLKEYESLVEPHDDWSVEQGRRDLQNALRAYGEGPDGWVFVKGPDLNLIRAGFLARCFPEAPFVMIFRDPAANIEGYRRKWKIFGDASLAEAIRFYASLYEDFLAAAEKFGDRVVGVEYEKLVANPESVMTEVGRRLGLEPATTQRRLEERPNAAGRGLRNVRDGKIEIVANASQESIDRLAEGEAEQIRVALQPLHARLQALPFVV